MRKSRRNADVADNAFLPGKLRRRVPFEFVLEALSSLSPYTRPMFGCTAVYVADKIVLILRDKPNSEADNGVWLVGHHERTPREPAPRFPEFAFHSGAGRAGDGLAGAARGCPRF